MHNLVSIIVPCYNAKKYVKQCVCSILNQTYKHIEVIIIDDGSIDGTQKILASFKDYRIRVLYQENKGVSSARNLGIEAAKGEYIMFVDADDTLHKECVQKCMNIITVKNVDIVKYSYIKKLGPICKKYKYCTPTNVVIDKKDFNEKIYKNIFCCFDFTNVWTMVIKSTVAKKVRFKKFSKGEDFLYSVNCLEIIKNIYITDEALYRYRIHRNSVTHKRSNSGTADEITVLKEISRITKCSNGIKERIRAASLR